MNRYVAAFFNATAGLEKFVVAVLAAVSTYIATIEAWSEPQRALVIGVIGAVQMLYTSNTRPTPPQAPLSDVDRIDA